MRVLLVSHLALPHHRAGVETYTHQLARALAAAGAEVRLASTRKVISLASGTIRPTEYDGISGFEVIQNLDGNGYCSTWRDPRMESAFARILADVRPDVVHFQHLMYWSVGLPRLAREAGARRLMTLHDFHLMCARMGQRIDPGGEGCDGPSEAACAPCMAATPWGQSPAARAWIRRLTTVRSLTGVALDGPMRRLERVRRRLAGRNTVEPARAAIPDSTLPEWRDRFHQRTAAQLALLDDVELFVTPSEALRQRFVAWGLPPERIRRVPQGLDPTPFAAVRHRPAEDGRIRLGFLGTIAPHKGVADLVAAVRRLPGDRVRLTVHGPGDQFPDYLADCRRAAAGAEHIAILGPLSRAEVPRAYDDLDVLCVPSRWDECCPLTIQEAFLAGTPCVVSGRGGMAELVDDGVDGLHARSGDVDDWERVLRRLLDEPALLPRLRAGIRPVRTADQHVQDLLALYRDLPESAPDASDLAR